MDNKKELVRYSLLLVLLFSGSNSPALQIANDTGTIINVEVKVHPTPSNNPCNLKRNIISFPNILNNMTKLIYDREAYLCSYDIRFSSVRTPCEFVECPAPMGYGSDYRVIIASFNPVKCYAYPILKTTCQ